MSDRSPFRHARADESPGFLLWQLTALWQGRLALVFDALGITQTQYAILASLRWFMQQAEAPTQARLVEHAKIEKMTLSKAIRRLESAGLVRRTPSTDDSRALLVRLTAEGRTLVQRAIVAVEDADDEFFGRLPARELSEFRRLARRLVGG